MKTYGILFMSAVMSVSCSQLGQTKMVGFSADRGLVIAHDGRTEAIVVVDPQAGRWERRSAEDLVKYIELMTGARARLAKSAEAIADATKQKKAPILFVGQQALRAEPSLKGALAKVAKKDPVLRADAIVLKAKGNRVYLAGTNDDSHYYAVVHLLRLWGCRWYLPTEIGECIPQHRTLTIEKLDHDYAPPFEVRGYWISWLGDGTGAEEFQHRNMMNNESVPSGHALSKYTKDLAPKGTTHWNVPIAEDATAEHVAGQIAPAFAKGQRISLGMEDGIYFSDSPVDNALKGNVHDKYMIVSSLTDPFMVFYNKVCRILTAKYPDSNAKIGFLAYSNITIPPQREIVAERPLVAYLAPIDIDPIHGMDDPRSPARQEYREMMYRWAKVMQGRVVIYDYDQGMLVWRSIPNPSIQSIRQDIKHYRKAGILGIYTESRNAIATTFLNLHVRGQLMWNPDTDVDALLSEFYPKFYGPAAKPMSQYWGAIFKAWEDTICTEHEFFVAPAIYTPQLVAELKKHLEAAETRVKPLAAKKKLSRNDKLILERMKFARLGFNVLENYMTMVFAAAHDVDYKTAVAAGERGLAAREALTDMNGTFTTYRRYGDKGPAWFPGEVQQYRELLELTDGTKGLLITRLPLEWAFHRDPNDTGLARGWAYTPADLTYWNRYHSDYNVSNRKDYPITEWEMVQTDLYPQAQGVLHPDWQSYTGFSWYKTHVTLTASQTQGKVYIRLPGLFGECWLYVNGYLIAHRPQKPLWWQNDSRYQWDVDLSGKFRTGQNDITLRVHNRSHVSGMFRRPFLYRPTNPGGARRGNLIQAR